MNMTPRQIRPAIPTWLLALTRTPDAERVWEAILDRSDLYQRSSRRPCDLAVYVDSDDAESVLVVRLDEKD